MKQNNILEVNIMASEKVTAILEEIKALTVLDLSELVHAIEDLSLIPI